ncbi:MAG: DUF3857 and transglutaminase domain-containing protein [Pseudomonadota bacterium]
MRHVYGAIRSIAISIAIFLSSPLIEAHPLNAVAAHIKINVIDLTWRVNVDGSTLYDMTVEREALSAQGAQSTTKFAQLYNKSLQTYEVVEAYTRKADGRKLVVEKDAMQIQRGVASGGSGASLPEAEILQITFPDVQKGDRTGWKVRLTTHTPQLKGWASLAEYLPPSVQIDQFRATLYAPRSVDLQVVAVGMRMVTTQLQESQVWQISGENKASIVDSNAANIGTTAPRLLASTFKDHQQLGAAFAKQFNAKSVVTDEIKLLAQKITEGKSGDRQKAVALHNWVRSNIRYVAVYLGTGGWVPHDVSAIVKNGYGDCKDQALLLQTLLKAVNIEAVPVLINSQNSYVLLELPVGFNHCIVYLPGLDLFADPTDNRIPLGSLPWADSDKPVVVALNEGARIMRTPPFNASQNRVMVKTDLAIDKAGRASGSLVIESIGLPATNLQDRLDQIPVGMAEVTVQKLLEQSRFRGTGKPQYPKVQRDVQAQSLTVSDLEIENLLNDPAGGSINPHPAFGLPVYILGNMGDYTSARRDYAVPCQPISVREEFALKFDPAFELLRIPGDFKVSNPDGIEVEARYTREGNSVTGWREMTLSHNRHVCSPAEFEARRAVMNRVARELRSGILFQQKAEQ